MIAQPVLIIDCHLDIGMNAIEWNRDLSKSVKEIRSREKGMNDKLDRAKGTVALQELRQGNIGLVVATQIARFVESGSPLPGWNSPEIAWGITQAQLAWVPGNGRDWRNGTGYQLNSVGKTPRPVV